MFTFVQMNVEKIRVKLDEWGIKHTWFAEQLGVSKTLLSLWLSNERQMPNDKNKQAVKILNELGKVPV